MDEPAALEMLRRCGSVAAGIYRRLGLTWVVIKGALKALADTRETQGVLCGVARAGKFKYSEEAGPLGAECGICGGVGSLGHVLQCSGMPQSPETRSDPEPTIEFLVELARLAREINVGAPIPRGRALEADLSLTMSTSEGDRDP